jgi:hypothetical protein
MSNMKKVSIALLCLLCAVFAQAGEGDQYWNVNAGFLFSSTLNASIGYERELNYGDAVELFGEAGNRWHRDPVCGKVCNDVFWKDHYWDGGLLYKKALKRYKNSQLRLRLGPVFGSHTGDYFFGVEGGFEYNYTFPCRVQFSVIQKNNVCFLHGDTFRNGLLIGIKVPF